MAVSIPTHVTSYWLDSTLGTILLYVCVAAGFLYGALSTTAFFTVMEEAISERYGEGKERGKLDFVHIAMPVRVIFYSQLAQIADSRRCRSPFSRLWLRRSRCST